MRGTVLKGKVRKLKLAVLHLKCRKVYYAYVWSSEKRSILGVYLADFNMKLDEVTSGVGVDGKSKWLKL